MARQRSGGVGRARRFAAIATAEPPAGGEVVMRRAVVLGGSIAGMLAARVLSDHATEVVVLERDPLDPLDAAEARAGAPQGAQVHALLEAGLRQVDRWYPGLSDELVAAGAGRAVGDSSLMYVDGVRKVAVPDVESICVSRQFLEARIRRRTLERGTIRVVHGRATGIRIVADRVDGVTYRPAGGPSEGGAAGTEGPGLPGGGADVADVVLEADLVVDAMGRSSRLGDWLERAGRQRPPVRRMHVDLNYATALFRRGAELPGVVAAVSYATPTAAGARDSIAMVAIEDNRWMVVLANYADNRPGRDEDDFVARAGACLPLFREAVTRERMIGTVTRFRQAESMRRDFHRMDRPPAGLVAVGDAVASFNPVYGQGMTSAMLHASCLSVWLRRGGAPRRPAREFFELVRLVVDAAWQTSTSADLSLPHVTGPYPRGYRLAARLGDLVVRASVTDVEINRRFLRVTHMREHPSLLARPGTLLRAAHVVRAQGRAAAGPG